MSQAHLERLLAVAVVQRGFAIGGARDPGAGPSRFHVLPSRGKPASFEADAAVTALAAQGGWVLAGTVAGTLHAVDPDPESGAPALALALGSPVRSLAVDGERIVAGCDDGALRFVRVAVTDARPALVLEGRLACGDRPLLAVAAEGGAFLAGADDGTAWSVGADRSPRALLLGGDGGVRAVALLGDGRFAAGFGDGSVRLGFLQGAVDGQDRSGEAAHDGAVRGLALTPALTDAAGRELPRRLVSVGEDGVLKAWPLDSKRRPKAFEPRIGTLTGVVVTRTSSRGAGGQVLRFAVVSRARKLAYGAWTEDLELVGDLEVVDSELARLAAILTDRRPRAVNGRKEALAALAALPEDDARVEVERALAQDPDPTVRVAAAHGLTRPASRQAARAALAAPSAEVRAAAFEALWRLDGGDAGVVRIGLAAAAEDVRILALRRLPAVLERAPMSLAGAVDALGDRDRAVRELAFATLQQATAVAPALRAVLGARPDDPLAAERTALRRGPPDLRALAITAVGQVAADPAARALVAGCLDDDDAAVRVAAFSATLVQHPRLLGRLRLLWPKLAERAPAFDGELGEDELAPLFEAASCRHADQAAGGVAALVHLGDPRAVGLLLRLTREASGGLRPVVAQVLAAARDRFPGEDRLEDRLTWLLDDADAQVRAVAFAALERTASDPVARLALAGIAIRATAPDVRLAALKLVVAHGKDQSAGHALLADAFDDEAPQVRSEALRTLWTWNPRSPEVPLERGARCRHADLRLQTATELARRRQARQGSAKQDALLLALCSDPAAEVALTAHAELVRVAEDSKRVEPHVAAMRSPAPGARIAGARSAPKAVAAAGKVLPNPLVAALYRLLEEERPDVLLAAIEALDAVAPKDATGFARAFDSRFWEVRVRAAELCGARRDARALGPCQKLLTVPVHDRDRPPDALRQRAASALADVGDPASIPLLTALLTDADPLVREFAARGLATACGPGREGPLVEALDHPDLSVRSWAAEGLARVGDLRALPVLAGTLRHPHRPLRTGAIQGFVALGPDGARGLRQGLEDPDVEVQELAFAVIVARDAALARAGDAPDLLVDALSAPNPELAFAAARVLEARAAGEAVDVSELVGPPRPERAKDTEGWPAESKRPALLALLVDSIASDDPVRRYAAARVQSFRRQPLVFWRECQRLGTPGELVPHTNWAAEARAPRRSGWSRRMVASGSKAPAPVATGPELLRVWTLLRATGGPAPVPVPPRDAALADVRRRVFGVYSGLVRAPSGPGSSSGPGDAHRVRRDAVQRLVALAAEPAVGRAAVLPVLSHAVRDGHHLVRQAAMAALTSLYPPGAIEPLALALDAASDVGRAAVDALLGLARAGDAAARELLVRALDAADREVRLHAALRLPRLFPQDSVEGLVLAAQSRWSDVRLEAVSRLLEAAGAGGTAVLEALAGALSSDDTELRLRAAQGLARRGDARGVGVLAALVSDEDRGEDALEALVALSATGGGAAAAALVARLEEDPAAIDLEWVAALGRIGHEAAVPWLLGVFAAPDPEGRAREQAERREAAADALDEVLRDRSARPLRQTDGGEVLLTRAALAVPAAAAAARCADPAIRARAAGLLACTDHRTPGVELDPNEVLARLLGDRDPAVRVAACEAVAARAERFGASLSPLEVALRGGRRELVLPAAEGLARRRRPEAFQALLLVLKAGEPAERERALLALGGLGDARALPEVVALLEPTEAGDASLVGPAWEALATLLPHLPAEVEDIDVADLRARVERPSGPFDHRRLLVGLRRAGDAWSRVLLERLARQGGGRLVLAAIEQLGLLCDPASEPVLADLAVRGDWRTARAAVSALRRVFPAEPTRVDLVALGAKESDLAAEAAQRLAQGGDPDVLLARLQQVRDGEVRQSLREGLVRRRALPAAGLGRALEADDALTRADGAWMAGHSGEAALASQVGTAAARAAAAWSGAKDARQDLAEAEAVAWRAALWAGRKVAGADVSAAARAGLAAAAPVEVRREAAAWWAQRDDVGALVPACQDTDPAVRSVASGVVARSARADEVLRALGDRVDPISNGPLLRAVLPTRGAALLAEVGTRGATLAVCVGGRELGALLAAARAPGEAPDRLAAIVALGRVGGDEARAALEALLADQAQPAAVRAQAWRAYKRLLRAATVRFADGVDREKRSGGGWSEGAGDEDGDGDDEDDEDEDDGDEDDEDGDDEDDEEFEDEDDDDE